MLSFALLLHCGLSINEATEIFHEINPDIIDEIGEKRINWAKQFKK